MSDPSSRGGGGPPPIDLSDPHGTADGGAPGSAAPPARSTPREVDLVPLAAEPPTRRRQKTPRLLEAAPPAPLPVTGLELADDARAAAVRKSRSPAPAPPPARRRRPRPWPVRVLGSLVRLTLWLAILGGSAVGGLLYYFATDPELPRIGKMSDYHPKVLSRVVDREGEPLGEIFEERRSFVPRAKIPDVMIHAIVDAEDAQFFEHSGLNYLGMLRALVNNLQPGHHLQGGSTITQQLVKTYLLKTNERTIKRKVQEVILAREIEAQLSKDEILTIYLNQIYFGHQRYGVDEAARFFFGKPIGEVNPGEAALLAALPKGPEDISPLKHPERAKERQRYVLSQMLRYRHVDQATADRYAREPIQIMRAQPGGAAPEYVDEARKLLADHFGADKIPTLGLTVKTACDGALERAAREALERGLEALDERQHYRDPVDRLAKPTKESIKALLEKRWLTRLRSVIEKPTRPQQDKWLEDRAHALPSGKVVEGVIVQVVPQSAPKGNAPGVLVDAGPERGFLPLPATLDNGRHDRYNPRGLPVEKRFRIGDVITVRAEPTLPKTSDGLPTLVAEFGPQAAVVVIEPNSREVRAMVGGYGFRPGGFNRALQAKRQPGSAFKPFLYATAFATGKYTPATVKNDAPQVFEVPGFREWKPKNAESHEFLGPVRLRVALAKSLNTVAAQLVSEIGPGPVAALARDAGIESKLEENLALGLGASVVTLYELTNAYTTFAAAGKRANPVTITDVGKDAEPTPVTRLAVVPEIAYLVTSMMESVIEDGTAVSAKGKLHRPAAGKTGTTSSERDAWFVGYTPDIVVGVWVGFDDMRDLGHGEQGARSALPIWVDVMNAAEKGLPPKPFLPPPGLTVARIDPATGLLAAPNAANAIEEKFLSGSQPTRFAEEAGAAGAKNPDEFITAP